MENQKSSRGIIALVIVLCLLVFGLGGYIVYDKLYRDIDSSNNMQYKYDEIAGFYTGSLKDELNGGTEGSDGGTNFFLELNSNGTFSFVQARLAPSGFIGNYIIKDNQIILNHLYSTNSGAGKSRTNGTTTITIDSNGSLTMTVRGQKLILTKNTNTYNENQFEMYLNSEEY